MTNTLETMMTTRLQTLSNRAKDIYQEEGLLTAIKRVLVFIISLILSENSVFYVYRLVLREGNEIDYLPKIPNITHRVVETVEQLDELAKEGFDLSLIDIGQSRYRLGKGAILSLLFVNREFGYISWSALTEEAKKTFNSYPYKVDFVNNEVCRGGAWTNPKYRRQGLSYYSSYKEEQYLIGKGAVKSRGIVLSTNNASQMGNEKSGAKLIAKARYIRIFSLEFWREKPVKPVNNKDN